ncbi:MAG TPA: hypothetical protein VKN63_01105 [Afifellaceae bacterium]|nr:hypothetical protein [Afifellaceae bacterium]
MANQGPQTAGRADRLEAAVSAAEVTSESFVRSVALALRAQWEGDDNVGSALRMADIEMDDGWVDYRAESEAAILAYLDLLQQHGFRIVRSLS